jgi:hypothetical protein
VAAHLTSAPAIVRIAGLPSEFLEGLPWHEGAATAAQILTLRGTLDALRREVETALYDEIPRHPPRERRQLLAFRRHCHNGRAVAGSLHELERLDFQGQDLAARLRRLVESETELTQAESAYAEEHASRHDWEVAVLAGPLRDPAVRRGLALASPSFSTQLEALATRPSGDASRRSGRLVHTLARYVTRAAFKLSPFSTLTPVALAEIRPVSDPPLRYLGGTRATTSSLRIKRYLLDQCCELLRRSPSVRPHLAVHLNGTLCQFPGHRYRFLRPPQLVESETDSQLTYSRYEQITVQLGGALPGLLLAHPPQGSLGRLLRDLQAEHPEAASADLARAVDQLVEIGFLWLAFPIPSYHPHFERGLRDVLSTLTPSPPLTAAVSLLDEILDVEEGYASAADPTAAAVGLEGRMVELHATLQSGLPRGLSVRLEKEPLHNLYEDCFEVSTEVPGGAVLVADETSLRRALDAGNLVWQIASFHESRHELLLTLEGFLDRWFGTRELVPLLDLFDRFQPVWEEYLEHLARMPLSRRSGGERRPEVFNPLGLAAVSDLAGMRLCLADQLAGILRPTAEGEAYPREELRRLVATLPSRWRNPLGPSLFLQPADPNSTDWVVNRIFEGNGRMSSRYTTVMPARIRQRYLKHYRERSTLDIDGESAELLDLQYTKKSTSSIHLPQTARVLVLPGERLDGGDAQAVEMRELFVRRTVGRPLAIVDARGRLMVPSFLSPLANQFLPSILKFLDAFGCGVRGNYNLPFAPLRSAGLVHTRRLRVGDLILKRASWEVERAALPSPALPAAEFFLQIQRWRREMNLPPEAYLVERNYDSGFHMDVLKPQYMCFESVTLVELLRESLQKKEGPLVFVEALPAAGRFPQDPRLGRRAVEIIVEWLALAPASERRSHSPSGEFYQPKGAGAPNMLEVNHD